MTTQTALPPTEKQVEYLNGLRDGKDLNGLTPEQIAWLRDADFSKVSRTKASDIITTLQKLPWARKEQPGLLPVVPDGRYAVHTDDGLKFYSVKNGRSVVFLDVWASDARWPVRKTETKRIILQLIADDPDAGPRFGREIGACYKCGRTLTDEVSRSLGIGPVCRGG